MGKRAVELVQLKSLRYETLSPPRQRVSLSQRANLCRMSVLSLLLRANSLLISHHVFKKHLYSVKFLSYPRNPFLKRVLALWKSSSDIVALAKITDVHMESTVIKVPFPVFEFDLAKIFKASKEVQSDVTSIT